MKLDKRGFFCTVMNITVKEMEEVSENTDEVKAMLVAKHNQEIDFCRRGCTDCQDYREYCNN